MNILLIHKFMHCEVECSFIFFSFPFLFFSLKELIHNFIVGEVMYIIFLLYKFWLLLLCTSYIHSFYIIFCFFCKVISMLLLSENYHLHNFFPSDLFVTKFCGTYWLYDFLIKVICIYLAYKVINMFSYF